MPFYLILTTINILILQMKKPNDKEVQTLNQNYMDNNWRGCDYDLRQSGSNVHAVNHSSKRTIWSEEIHDEEKTKRTFGKIVI